MTGVTHDVYTIVAPYNSALDSRTKTVLDSKLGHHFNSMMYNVINMHLHTLDGVGTVCLHFYCRVALVNGGLYGFTC